FPTARAVPSWRSPFHNIAPGCSPGAGAGLERLLFHLTLEALLERQRRGEQETQPEKSGRVLAQRGGVGPDGEAEEEERGGAEGEDRHHLRPPPPLEEKIL